MILSALELPVQNAQFYVSFERPLVKKNDVSPSKRLYVIDDVIKIKLVELTSR